MLTVEGNTEEHSEFIKSEILSGSSRGI
jgi:hypothetical protein